MKVCILGPIISDKHFGGIATFNEGLKEAFEENGDNVLVITDIDNNDCNTRKFKKIKIILNDKKIIECIKEFNPDIIISSMWYGILNKSIKKVMPKSTVIQFIHGFPTYRYKFYKRYMLNSILKLIRKNSDFFIANSTFTSCINNEIYGITCDKVIHIGIKEKFEEFEKVKSKNTKIVFAGRIVKEKNVDKVCEIFEYINKFCENTELTVIGEGPEKNKLSNTYKNKKIKFIGKKTREEMFKILEESDIFISLNPHEPFGLVYLEALLKKCKIICPNTGGQVEFLSGIEEVLFIDINDYTRYKDKFIELIQMDCFDDTNLKEKFLYFNYQRVVNEIIELKTGLKV